MFNGRLLHFSPHFPNTKKTTKESNRNNRVKPSKTTAYYFWVKRTLRD
jgi:hypothetical protein